MASDPFELLLEERMMRLQTDGTVMGLGLLMGQSEYRGSEGGDEAVHGAAPKGVPAQLFLGGGWGLKEEVQDGVELFLVDNPPGVDFCGDFIGRERSRFCCILNDADNRGCPVEGHVRKAPLLTDHAYIRCLPSSRGPRMDAAFVSPALCLTHLSDIVMLELDGIKTIENWSRVFSLVESGVGILDDEDKVIEMLAKQQKEVSFAPTTPAKGRRLTELEVGLAEIDSKPRGAIVGCLMPTSESPGESIAVMVANWNKVVDSLEQVQLAVPRLEYLLERMTEESETCMEGIDAKIMLVRAQVGKPPENFKGVPAPDLWNSAVHFESNLQELRTTMLGMNAGLKDARSQIELQKRAAVDSALLKQQVEQVHSFMGKVYGEVIFAQQEMLKMQRASQSSGDAALGATLAALEACTSALERNDVTSGSMMELVKETAEHLGLMEVETGNLKSSIGGDVVKIGSRAFHSSGEIEVWLAELGGDGDWADVFFDFISMLETCLDVSRTSDEHFAREGAAHKGGYESLMSGRVLSSFSTTVPALFNKATGGPFSRILTFKDWDSEDEREGLVPDVNRRLLQWTEQHQRRIEKRLGNHSQARELADRMLFDSTKFWNDLVTFIAQYYRRLTANDENMSLSEVQNQFERRAAEAAIKQSRQVSLGINVENFG